MILELEDRYYTLRAANNFTSPFCNTLIAIADEGCKLKYSTRVEQSVQQRLTARGWSFRSALNFKIIIKFIESRPRVNLGQYKYSTGGAELGDKCHHHHLIFTSYKQLTLIYGKHQLYRLLVAPTPSPNDYIQIDSTTASSCFSLLLSSFPFHYRRVQRSRE